MGEALNALGLPLQGSQLIEASAGTGKTWTIAALFVRLVVGHGSPPRQPGEILVMTFTKAATRELSDRIRRRLVQAAAWFRGESALAQDDFLAELMEEFPAGPDRQQAAWRLAVAAEAMDDAAVHTIDAWCQRMLREHAFDSGCLFDEELQAQETAMRDEAARDYWRQQVYPLDDDMLAGVLLQWKDVAALTHDVAPLIDKPLPVGAAQGSLAEVLQAAVRQRVERVAELKSGWGSRADEMLDWLSAQWHRRDCPIDKRKLGEALGSRWLRAVKEWALDGAQEVPTLGAGRHRLTRQGVLDSLKPGLQVDIPACFDALEPTMAALDALPQPGPFLRLHAAADVLARLQVLKQRTGSFGFADMLNRLDAALDESVHGARARRLRERILAQYPVALIDEFQDTSPIQLRIFDRLFRIANNEPSRALLLIGDPKQAIYGFRGADIYSYLSARKATEGRHHRLDTNHRSSKALVSAVNTLFWRAEDRAGEGAFMFRQGDAASDLPFVPVRAQGRAERLVHAQGGVPAVTLVFDETLRNKEDSRTLFAALCAERIVQWLNDPQAGFEAPGEPFRRLRPADIAVLVRSGTEADAVRHEMRRRGLASVYLSDKDTVFRTPEAEDLLRLLQAAASPRDVRLVRAALATPLLGLTLRELLALATDDAHFDRQCEVLAQLNQVWQAQGVLAMVRQALHAFALPARWLAARDPAQQGERRLTNVLHLAELLQGASPQAEGEQALVRWLIQEMKDSEAGLEGGDERVLRLESDADLVKVVTVHKSKGLEYPVVLLPFPAHFRELISPGEHEESAVLMLPADGAAGGRELVLSPSGEQLALAEKERQRESLRLLYVAATRARHALWVGLSGLQVGGSRANLWHRSAIGYLLSGAEVQPPEQRWRDVLALAGASAEVVVEPVAGGDGLPLPAPTRLARRMEPVTLAQPPAYTAQFERQWSIGSYSALVRDAAWAPIASGAVTAHGLRDDEPDEADDTMLARRPANGAWHRFPRGALAGNFLHDQLEWLAGEQFELDASSDLQQRLIKRCERQGWGHRADDALAWLRRVCSTPLPALGTALSGLTRVAPEMEFWLPSDGLQARRLDALCQQHLLPGQPRPQLPERALKGMLMGFADLVFEHDGRFWVLDYKSNALGSRDGDYTREAMKQSILEHRYDVQAALYLLALHRLLKSRLGSAYAPERHLGGAIFFFLRGVDGPTAGCCEVAAPLALIEQLDAMLGPEAE
jgi:exodeoxyribonuclease V beta subunit